MREYNKNRGVENLKVMPKLSPARRKRLEEFQSKARKLYAAGFTLREVGRALGKSHAWVATALGQVKKKEKGK